MTMTSSTAAQSAQADFEFVLTQAAHQSLARVFLGANVTNPEGRSVGDVNDLIFDKTGTISAVVIGVGGLLGMGEKIIAVPFNALKISSGSDGARTITLEASTDALQRAPSFTATEKTTMDSLRDKAVDLGHRTADKANELKIQAAKRIDAMTKSQPVDK